MTIAVPVPCLILRYAISRRSYDALSPPRPWAGARVAPLRKAHHLLIPAASCSSSSAMISSRQSHHFSSLSSNALVLISLTVSVSGCMFFHRRLVISTSCHSAVVRTKNSRRDSNGCRALVSTNLHGRGRSWGLKHTLGCGRPSSTDVAAVSVSSSSDAIAGVDAVSEVVSDMASSFFLRLLGV